MPPNRLETLSSGFTSRYFRSIQVTAASNWVNPLIRWSKRMP